MKMIRLMIGVVVIGILHTSCMNNRKDTTDTFKDTVVDEDTAYRTDQGTNMRSDTFVPTDTDPRRQGIEDESRDSIRVKRPDNQK